MRPTLETTTTRKLPAHFLSWWPNSEDSNANRKRENKCTSLALYEKYMQTMEPERRTEISTKDWELVESKKQKKRRKIKVGHH